MLFTWHKCRSKMRGFNSVVGFVQTASQLIIVRVTNKTTILGNNVAYFTATPLKHTPLLHLPGYKFEKFSKFYQNAE